jgi:hypothetical protein
MPHEIFADEIAIDFPSVDHLIERVRVAFLGEPESPEVELLTRDVSLSRARAATGATVPLEVPLRDTCRICGGRGESWAEPCLACAGSGETRVSYPVRFSVPAGVTDGARFRFRVTSPGARSVRVEVRVGIRTH